MQDRLKSYPIALPALLAALLAIGAAGSDVLDSIALAIVLLPACEAALAAADAAVEESAPAVRFPRRGPFARAAALHRPSAPARPRARAHGAWRDGFLLPLLA